MFLKKEWCISAYSNMEQYKSIVIYGAGTDGKKYIQENKTANILFIMDKAGSQKLFNYKIYDFNEAISKIKRLQEVIILICSRNHWKDMSNSLNEEGFIIGKDYFIVDFYDHKSIHSFIDINKKRWESEDCLNSKAEEVILPFVDGPNEIPIIIGYVGKILQRKYKARLLYTDSFSNTSYEPNISPIKEEVYRSFGISNRIDTDLNYIQIQEAEELFNKQSDMIHSISDWKKVEINGDDIGSILISVYLRYYELSLNPRNKPFLDALKTVIREYIYWRDYFKTHIVKCIVLWDGFCQERIIVRLALRLSIPIYVINNEQSMRVYSEKDMGLLYPRYKELFNSLSVEDKERIQEWGRSQLKLLINSNPNATLPYKGYTSLFAEKQDIEIQETQNIKVVICPHIFEEESNCYGSQLFNDNYIEWLDFLGKMSEETDYDWYIKMHPDEKERGLRFFSEYLKKYKKIKLIPQRISPLLLKEKGFIFAFTVRGSISHEYPYFGINVINAGDNPHMSFDFSISPKSRDEYEVLIKDLNKLNYEPNLEELYQYYGLLYYYQEDYPLRVKKDILFFYKEWFEFCGYKELEDSELYIKRILKFTSFCTDEIHKILIKNTIKMIDELDYQKPNELAAKL